MGGRTRQAQAAVRPRRRQGSADAEPHCVRARGPRDLDACALAMFAAAGEAADVIPLLDLLRCGVFITVVARTRRDVAKSTQGDVHARMHTCTHM